MPESKNYWATKNAADFFPFGGSAEIGNASDHNVFYDSGDEFAGYLADHISKSQRRNFPESHWDPKYANTSQTVAAELSSSKRTAILDLIRQLAEQQSDKFKILHLSAGPGAFTADITQISNVHVTHVDFSKNALRAAEQVINQRGNAQQVQLIKDTNIGYLDAFVRLQHTQHQNQTAGMSPDLIIAYGGIVENEPSVSDVKKTFQLAAQALKPGGHIIYVGAVQPRLSDEQDISVTDILGEYPHQPGLVDKILLESGVQTMVSLTHLKQENHPLEPGGQPTKHTHMFERRIFAKPLSDGTLPQTPTFSFK